MNLKRTLKERSYVVWKQREKREKMLIRSGHEVEEKEEEEKVAGDFIRMLKYKLEERAAEKEKEKTEPRRQLSKSFSKNLSKSFFKEFRV